MNADDQELIDLIHACLNGRATDAQASRLNSRLRADAAARDLYLQLADTHSCLAVDERLWVGNIVESSAYDFRAFHARQRWFSWRPLTAAAVGLVLGLFSATLMWAYASPRAPFQRKWELPVANANFEESVPPVPEGVPIRYSIWSGDYAEIVGAQQGVAPREGRYMLRFLRSDSAQPESDHGSAGNMYQIIDMQRWREAIRDGQSKVDFSAWFHWVPGANEQGMTFAINVWAFTGSTSILPYNWKDHLYQETAKAGKKIAFDETPNIWRQLKASLIVPPETDFLVVELKVIPKTPKLVDAPYDFPGCFADQVELTLRSDRPPAPHLPIQ